MMPQQSVFVSRRLRLAGTLVILGLLVQGLTLLWNHPLAFLSFLGLGGLLLFAGIVIYLFALISAPKG
ncbi:MAG TPA: hypothetical protein VN176_18325 [Verrucomicrobiae bacterium]|jgi:hypothetical protein|nr:hypothetical protein [Verrucomicrobiae bacterium]